MQEGGSSVTYLRRIARKRRKPASVEDERIGASMRRLTEHYDTSDQAQVRFPHRAASPRRRLWIIIALMVASWTVLLAELIILW